MDFKKIGSKIKELREKNEISQTELAFKIRKTESSVRKYESGLVEIPLSVLEQIAYMLNTDLNYLLNFEVDYSKISLESRTKYYSQFNMDQLTEIYRQLNKSYMYHLNLEEDEIDEEINNIPIPDRDELISLLVKINPVVTEYSYLNKNMMKKILSNKHEYNYVNNLLYETAFRISEFYNSIIIELLNGDEDTNSALTLDKDFNLMNSNIKTTENNKKE